MSTMRQLTYLKPGVLEWQDVPAPVQERDDDAIVRPIAVALCDLDVAVIRGLAPFEGPFGLGHEFVAEVAECGDSVAGVTPGQQVVVPFQISCGTCDRCQAALTGSCRTVPRMSMYGLRPLGGDWGAALSDLVRVPFASSMLVPVPAGVKPDAIASLSDNVADAWRTVGPPLRETPGADVLIVGGLGSIPLYAVAIARALGASKVDYVDTHPRRLAVAESLGARVIKGPPPHRAGDYAITVDASADPAGLACALRSLSPEGICTSCGIYWSETSLPLLEMYTRGVRFQTGRVNSRAVIPHVLDLVATGRLRPELVTSETIAWEDAPHALARPSTKVVVVRN